MDKDEASKSVINSHYNKDDDILLKVAKVLKKDKLVYKLNNSDDFKMKQKKLKYK